VGAGHPRPPAHQHARPRAVRRPGPGPQLLQYNADVEIAICIPEAEADYFYRDGEGDEVVFVHEGGGVLETIFGSLPFRKHDYVVIPRGTTYRFRFDGPQRWLTFYTPGEIETPNRYRNRYGQLLEHAPFSHRDFHPPATLETHRERGEYDLKVRVRGGYQDYVLDYHPFDVVGWDGYVYPYTFNIDDFEPEGRPPAPAAAGAPDRSRARTSSSARSARACSTGTRTRSRCRTTTPTCSRRR
jgi:homogentisate 1,2-dioxygenase